MKRILISILLTLCANTTWALSSDVHQLVHIQADTVQYNHKTGIAKYRGHVRVNQGSTKVIADQITLYRNQHNDIEKIVATGHPAHYSTQPDAQNATMDASANSIQYFPLQGRIVLLHNGVATLGPNRIASDRIEYNLKQQLLETQATASGQTTIVLEPTHRANRPPKKTSA